jgi:hypothetical protein
LGVVFAYLCSKAVLLYASEHYGLVGLSGSPHFSVAALVLIVLVLRLVVLFCVPVVLVYRLAGRLLLRRVPEGKGALPYEF